MVRHGEEEEDMEASFYNTKVFRTSDRLTNSRDRKRGSEEYRDEERRARALLSRLSGRRRPMTAGRNADTEARKSSRECVTSSLGDRETNRAMVKDGWCQAEVFFFSAPRLSGYF